MVDNASLLIALVQLIDVIPPPPPPPTGRVRPKVYSDRLFLKALVIMIVRHLSTVLTFGSSVTSRSRSSSPRGVVPIPT